MIKLRSKHLFLGLSVGAAILIATTATSWAAEGRPKAKKAEATRPVVLQRSDADLYAATLAGRYAQNVNDPRLAAQAWVQAFYRRPHDVELYDQATAANLEIGNFAMVVRMAKLVPATQRTDEAVLALAVEAFMEGRFADAGRLLESRAFDAGLTQFASHLRAYALLGQGQTQAAVDLAAKPTGSAALDEAALMSRAFILAHAGRSAEAISLLDQAHQAGQDSPTGLRLYGQLLTAAGRQSDAIARLTPFATGNSPMASALSGALADAQAGGRVVSRSSFLSSATSGLLTLVEARKGQRASGETTELLYLLAFLNPGSSAVNAVLGQHLVSYGQADQAELILSRVGSTSPDYVAAQVELAWLIYDRDPVLALQKAERLAAAQDVPAAWTVLADMLAANRRDLEAEAAYHRLIQTGEAGRWSASQMWPLYFGRGGARERLGRWQEALADLRQAKTLAPNQANVLNYLGYALADRGENLDEALGLLRSAMRLRPRSGAIADSYGWALFKLGRYEEAVGMLERAAILAPTLAEVADHLGDAYWRTGHEDEARMEWGRALSLSPPEDMAAALEIKLDKGLPPDPRKAADAAIIAQSKPR